jgi:hypothetical protein
VHKSKPMGLFRRFRPIYLFGIAALAIIAAGAIRNELLGPLIRPVPVMSNDPLTLPFTVFNPAFLVTLKDIDMTCENFRLLGRAPSPWSAGAEPFPLDVDIDLGPRMAFEYTCPIKSRGIKRAVDKVDARVGVRYTRFGRREKNQSAILTWDSISKVWTQERR